MSKMGNISYYIDRIVLGNHAYKPYGDPEGLLSTIPAIVTALLGMFTGRYVKESDDSGEKKTLKLLGAAVITGVAATLWSIWFPVIKNLLAERDASSENIVDDVILEAFKMNNGSIFNFFMEHHLQ